MFDDIAIVGNVSQVPVMQSLGLLGKYIVPARLDDEAFGMLVIEAKNEIIDEGNKRTRTNLCEARKIAEAILGIGNPPEACYSQQGLFIADAEFKMPPQIPALRQAANGPGRLKINNVTARQLMLRMRQEEAAEIASKEEIEESLKFLAQCRTLVTSREIAEALRLYRIDCGRLVQVADVMHSRPAEQKDITDRHRRAAAVMNLNRPWAFVAEDLKPCPVCSEKIGVSAAICRFCNYVINESKLAEFRRMDEDIQAKSKPNGKVKTDQDLANDEERLAKKEEQRAAKIENKKAKAAK